jgi:hypothetical protein
MYRTHPICNPWDTGRKLLHHRVTRCILFVIGHHETALGGPRGAERLVGRASRKPTACGLEFHPPDFLSPACAKVQAGRAAIWAALTEGPDMSGETGYLRRSDCTVSSYLSSFGANVDPIVRLRGRLMYKRKRTSSRWKRGYERLLCGLERPLLAGTSQPVRILGSVSTQGGLPAGGKKLYAITVITIACSRSSWWYRAPGVKVRAPATRVPIITRPEASATAARSFDDHILAVCISLSHLKRGFPVTTQHAIDPKDSYTEPPLRRARIRSSNQTSTVRSM